VAAARRLPLHGGGGLSIFGGGAAAGALHILLIG